MSRKGAPLLLASLLLLGGCADIEPGPITEPPLYPDRTSAEAVFHSFLWAWRNGDIPALKQCLGGGLADTLKKQLRVNGPEKTAAFYRDEQLEILDVDWVDRRTTLARVRLVLRGSKIERKEVIFYCVRRRVEDWTISGKKVIPR